VSQANAELVRSSYEEFNRSGKPSLRLYDPAVQWHTRADLPDSGVHRGHEGIAALAGQWGGSFEELRLDVEDIIDRGEHILVPLTVRGRIRGSEEEVAMSETHICTVSDGLITEVREYGSLEGALRIIGRRDQRRNQ
jgi:ketosteroid isomerase-like protein